MVIPAEATWRKTNVKLWFTVTTLYSLLHCLWKHAPVFSGWNLKKSTAQPSRAGVPHSTTPSTLQQVWARSKQLAHACCWAVWYIMSSHSSVEKLCAHQTCCITCEGEKQQISAHTVQLPIFIDKRKNNEQDLHRANVFQPNYTVT